MSQRPSKELTPNAATISETTEVLDIIREEQITPTESNANVEPKLSEEECPKEVICNCTCRNGEEHTDRISPEELEEILKEREATLREEYDKRFEKEMSFVKDRFDFILSNEQVRASYMLREAHRERQEKITALQTQLECKNLAGLMYVMCSERRRSKLERLRLIEEYTNYIRALQDILTEGQALILHLSRGYKTASRIDHEWRLKMKRIVQELGKATAYIYIGVYNCDKQHKPTVFTDKLYNFMSFIYHYSGGTPETNQYFFDLPRLMKTKASKEDDPLEDPCEAEELEEEPLNAEAQGDKSWWEGLDGDCRPFVMFGDMADFKPDRRREVLNTVKVTKTAPRKWKEYVFNEMFLKADCPNSESIKDVYPEQLPDPQKWECAIEVSPQDARKPRESIAAPNPRNTAMSIDIRGEMTSLLKIITSTNANAPQQAQKTALLGARDSMEIRSTTRLREKSAHKQIGNSKVVLSVGKRRTSIFEDVQEEEEIDEVASDHKTAEDDASDEAATPVGTPGHNDSLHVLPNHASTNKDRINYEKVCPMDKCHRMQVDSFVRSLPPYMRANPYTHFEQNFEEYETCSPEQLEILKQRMEAKKAKEVPEAPETCPLAEWTPSQTGVMTQTSDLSIDLPPCTCNLPSPNASTGMVFNDFVLELTVKNVADLIPVKQALECISKACFFDENIQFDRFKVIGEDTSDNANGHSKLDFKQRRYHEIRKILKQHPSLLDIFQANTRC